MKKTILILVITITLWGDNLSLASISGQASIGSVSSLKKSDKKNEKPYSLEVENNKLQCTFKDESKKSEIHFLSTRGQILAKHSFEKGDATIDLSEFASALYLVKGYQGGEVIFAKAIQIQ